MSVWIVYFSLILTRVGVFLAALPVLGGTAVPRSVKAGLAMALTVFWFGSIVPAIPADEYLHWNGHTPWLAFGIALGREAILGALLGFAFGLFLVPFHVAGEFITQEMGLNYGNLVSATGTGTGGPLTQIFEIIATLLFLGLDGHHVFLAVLHSTFTRIPIGQALPELPLARLVAGASAAEEWGLILAAPVALLLFLTTVVLTLMARAAPQLNLYSVGFPLRLVTGFGAILVLLPNLIALMVYLFGRLGELLAWLV